MEYDCDALVVEANGCLDKVQEVDCLESNGTKEDENIDSGANCKQTIADLEDLVKHEGVNLLSVESGVTGTVSSSKSSKKSAMGQDDQLRINKKEKASPSQKAPQTTSLNQRAALSKSLTFPSKKSIVSNDSRKHTIGMKQLKPETKGMHTLKRVDLASKASNIPCMGLKVGSVDATSIGTLSEVAQSMTPQAASQRSSGAGFAFRLDERAEKRKEFFQKLEEKIQAKEVEKTNLQAKSKENQEAEIKQLRKSLTFKATPMPTFYKEPGPPKVELKKIPTTRAISPKLGRRNPSAAAENAAADNTPTRITQSSLDTIKLDEGMVNGNGGPISSRKQVQKLTQKQPSQKSTVRKTNTRAPVAKPKVTDPEHDATKAKSDLEDNPEKNPKRSSEEAANAYGPELVMYV